MNLKFGNWLSAAAYDLAMVTWLLVVLSFPVSAQTPQRIISTMPSNTEILSALGLEDQIVGVTARCNFPASIIQKEKIGDAILNVEKIVSLKPDLIVMLEDAQKAEIQKLKNLKLPVLALNPHSLAEVISSIEIIGKATGREKEAGVLVNKMKARLTAVKSRIKPAKKPKIFVEIWPQPLITAGRGTFIDDIIKLAGGINIAGGVNLPYPEFSYEKLLYADPDCIIVLAPNFPRLSKNLQAVKNNRIIFIPADLLTRPGPRLPEALEELVKFIYE